MKLTLLHTGSMSPAPIAEALTAEGVEVLIVRSPRDLVVGEDATAFVLDPAARATFDPQHLRSFVDSGGAIVALGAPDEIDVPSSVPSDLLAAWLPHPYGTRHLLLALHTTYREAAVVTEAGRARQEAASRTKEVVDLTRIGVALATERDYNTLLDMILSQARQITSSDAGSLYLVETTENGAKRLRFKLAQTFSRPEIPLVEFTMPIDRASIAGYVASTGEPLVIDDAYFLAPDVQYSINRSLDEKYGYRTKSMLTIPMKDHKEEVIGVLQLINRKRHFEAQLKTPPDFEAEVIPYTKRTVELVSSLAGQAAVSIENSRLYESIERLFEGFVTAAVTAIEQRDPTTFGHSGRVASMTVGLAEVVDRASDGPFRNVKFSKEEVREIRYAGLLHDFGKVGVREQVLVKAKKLYEPDLQLIRQRYAFARRTIERDYYCQLTEHLQQNGASGEHRDVVQRLKDEQARQLASLDRFMKLVLESNEPTVLPEGSFEELLRYADAYYHDLEGQKQPYLTADEVRFLSIRKGSLDERERLEIESHVNHTYRFLLQIPWTKELQNIPTIAYGHHEKLDGSGYPRKVTGELIPVQTRMMTISDIFDALTASDRPYKRAVPVPRALDIMTSEVKTGMLDPDLFKLFVEGKAYEKA
ncbi:MAG: GAF domain-containing protein [Gemmatimonadetes bacterium]|nr:GAF domain-containing protein [Gemmatimonadota bacterium]